MYKGELDGIRIEKQKYNKKTCTYTRDERQNIKLNKQKKKKDE